VRRITNLSQRGNSTGRSPDHRAWARPRDSACQVRHVGMFHLGRMHVAHDDGTDGEMGPAEANVIKPGRDAWVVGNDPVIAFEFESQSEDYAVLNPPTLGAPRRAGERSGAGRSRHLLKLAGTFADCPGRNRHNTHQNLRRLPLPTSASPPTPTTRSWAPGKPKSTEQAEEHRRRLISPVRRALARSIAGKPHK
jgi:hypothetical protein